jgi:hypothetical protein
MQMSNFDSLSVLVCEPSLAPKFRCKLAPSLKIGAIQNFAEIDLEMRLSETIIGTQNYIQSYLCMDRYYVCT